jgi:outer membrane protein
MTLSDGENPFILAPSTGGGVPYNVSQIEGELLPRVTLDADYTQRFGQSRTLTEQQVFTVLGRVDVPLYQGGGRRAHPPGQGDQQSAQEEVEDARLRIHAEVVSNWAQLQSTASQIKSAQDALAEANGSRSKA